MTAPARAPAGRGAGSAGFTLMEVMVAVLLLSLSLTALLQVQSHSIAQAGRARDLTIAVGLARAKIIDMEQQLFHQGLQFGEQVQEGDFADQGHPEVHFRAQISEVMLDLSNISEAVGAFAQKRGEDKVTAASASGEAAGMFAQMAPLVEPVVQSIARGLRVMDLEVSWPVGTKRTHFSLRALVAQDDYSTMVAGDAARGQRELQGYGLGGAPGAAPAAAPPPGASP